MYDDGICSGSQKTACQTRNFRNNPRLILKIRIVELRAATLILGIVRTYANQPRTLVLGSKLKSVKTD
jgi:hypothetical protein